MLDLVVLQAIKHINDYYSVYLVNKYIDYVLYVCKNGNKAVLTMALSVYHFSIFYIFISS